MTKKRQNYPSVKPVNTVHPSLTSSSARHHHGDSHSSSTSERSVNDLIQHLRRTQLVEAGYSTTNPLSVLQAAPRSVHPSIRNILELPETPPPKPRTRVRPVGRLQARWPTGPPPPPSWLEGASQSVPSTEGQEEFIISNEMMHYRLDRLPGINVPAKGSLQHTILKSMALNWIWHVDYDGVYLAELPSRLKMLLLSYIAVYSRKLPLNRCMGGIQHLFPQAPHSVVVSEDSEITRLDLSGALGRWLNFKQMIKDLILRNKMDGSERSLALQDAIPSSWDEDPQSKPAPLSQLKYFVRFENLRFLSLANPDPRNASWATLLHLLSHISTLTHLSLAFWPVPTLASGVEKTPIRHSIRSSSSSSNTTTLPSLLENDQVEILSVLRKLSRATYCLKWLDLEGCGDWTSVLRWDGITADSELNLSACIGPEWNGPWRDIEWIGLGPGWKPESKTEATSGNNEEVSGFDSKKAGLSRLSTYPSASIHALHSEDSEFIDPALFSDVGAKRAQYRRIAQIKLYRDTLEEAEKIEKHIRRLRKEGGGKWVRFSKFSFEEQ